MTDQRKCRALLEAATEFYLNSRDFNGCPVASVFQKVEGAQAVLEEALVSLVSRGRADLVFGDGHPNPHIRAFAPPPPEKQLQKLRELGWSGACVYPSSAHLSQVVAQTDYADRPFTRELALGRPQLDFDAFDVSILESFRNDPRYWYTTHDRGGSIGVSDEHYESGDMREGDRILLQSFGYGFDENLCRAVIVFICYLSRLSPAQQGLWRARQLDGEYKMHPDYYRSTILGQFPEELSLFEAFLMELHEINLLAALVGKPPLFRETWEEDRPRGFGWIVRATTREFNAFVHLMDKMLSENLNREFFRADIELETQKTRGDGKVEVQQKGTIRLMSEWLEKRFVAQDQQPLREMLETLHDIRNLRQKPAHTVESDIFDRGIFERQRKLMMRAYSAVRTIREVFQNHPRAAGHQVAEHLAEGRICTY